MHQTIATDDSGVCQSVSDCCVNAAAERIEVLLGVEALRDPNIVLDGDPDLPLNRLNAAFVKLL